MGAGLVVLGAGNIGCALPPTSAGGGSKPATPPP